MTLLEVLVALTIATIVFATVFLIYRAAATTALRQRETGRTSFAPAGALAALQRDLAALIPEGLDDACIMKLSTQSAGPAGPLSEMEFCAWRPDEGPVEGLWADAVKIRWRVENPGTLDARLTRIETICTGPRSAAPPVTNHFMPGIATFRLLLHDGTTWLPYWPPNQTPNKKPVTPRSLRAEIAISGGLAPTNWTTDFLLPVGLVATSRIERIPSAL